MTAERFDNPDDARQAAAEFGCDLSQIDYLLTLTPQQRLEHHELVRRALPALRAAGRKYLGFDPRPDHNPELKIILERIRDKEQQNRTEVGHPR